jgi:hypothetical protein
MHKGQKKSLNLVSILWLIFFFAVTAKSVYADVSCPSDENCVPGFSENTTVNVSGGVTTITNPTQTPQTIIYQSQPAQNSNQSNQTNTPTSVQLPTPTIVYRTIYREIAPTLTPTPTRKPIPTPTKKPQTKNTQQKFYLSQIFSNFFQKILNFLKKG